MTVILVIATKAIAGRGTPLRGGIPSGHAALAFAGWMALTYQFGDAHHGTRPLERGQPFPTEVDQRLLVDLPSRHEHHTGDRFVDTVRIRCRDHRHLGHIRMLQQSLLHFGR